VILLEEAIMDALTAILSRRSIRRYTDKKVSDEVIKSLLEAAMAAPSANGKSPWQFLVVTERAKLDAVPSVHPYSKMLFEAPLAILVCGDMSAESNIGYLAIDCSAAVENILVAANSLGLGGVWLGVYPRDKRIRAMQTLFKVPEKFIPLALISLGYPAEQKPPSARFDEARVHHNIW
jgi:nitroreductase